MRPWQWLRRMLYAGLRNETEERLKSSAVIFAPHQDDETLGCGGTIMLKRKAGTPVACVFMTDGSTSHRSFMKDEQLRSLRKEEAINAAEVLGLSTEDVHFLDFPDGNLKCFHTDAVTQIVALLERYCPEEVYVPYRADGLQDHEGTHAVVTDALNKVGRPVEICEYPIWFWNQWPWVPFHIRCNRESGRMLWRMLFSGFGLRLLLECRSGIFVGDLLEKKKHALNQYRSQMTVLIPGTAWPTLRDVSDGEFLKCFFQEFEIFRCRNIPGRNSN